MLEVLLKRLKKNLEKKINLGVFDTYFQRNTNDARDSKVFDMIKMFNKKY